MANRLPSLENLHSLMSSIELNSYLEYIKNLLNPSDLNAPKVFKIVGGAAIGLTFVYLGKIWYSYGYFKRRGIKTPKYQFITGNLIEIVESNYSDVLRNWTNQYGKVYGYYEGHLPILVTSDLEIIQEAFIKQFNNFSGRKRVPFQEEDDGINMNLFTSSSNRWRRMRNIMNPTFSSAKLKQLLPEMRKSSERLINMLENNIDKDINIVNYFDSFAMDVVWNTIFGLDIDCLNNSDNLFLKKGIEYFQDMADLKFVYVFDFLFFEFRPIMISIMTLISYVKDRINSAKVNPWFWLIQNMKFVLKKRIANNVVKNDYVQILLDTQTDNAEISNLKKKEIAQADLKPEKKMSLSEINLNLVLFLLAGFETTSTTLSYCIFILLKHPEELNKLRDEIDQHYPPGSDIEPNNENMQQLEYLDLFVKEVLRMYPVANNIIARRCTNATKVKGMDIPVNLVIAVDVLSLHYDPEIWGPVDPNEFYPLRFADEDKKNTLAYLPFGIGPRICIGMKFALMEVKLTLIKVLQKFDLVKSPKTPETISSYAEGVTRRPKDGLNVILMKRKDLSN